MAELITKDNKLYQEIASKEDLEMELGSLDGQIVELTERKEKLQSKLEMFK